MCFHLFINMRFILAQCLQDHLFYVNSFQTDQVNVPTQKRITRSNRIEIFFRWNYEYFENLGQVNIQACFPVTGIQRFFPTIQWDTANATLNPKEMGTVFRRLSTLSHWKVRKKNPARFPVFGALVWPHKFDYRALEANICNHYTRHSICLLTLDHICRLCFCYSTDILRPLAKIKDHTGGSWPSTSWYW